MTNVNAGSKRGEKAEGKKRRSISEKRKKSGILGLEKRREGGPAGRGRSTLLVPGTSEGDPTREPDDVRERGHNVGEKQGRFK